MFSWFLPVWIGTLTLLLGPPPAASAPATLPGGPVALDALNAVRRLAAVPVVTRQPSWEVDCAAHARYLVLTDRAEHREDPQSPYRSAQGEACAPGHYFVSSQPSSRPERAITYWATGAFHLPQLINPRMQKAAFAVAFDRQGTVQSAAVLDVRRGQNAKATYPVRFPAPGTTSPFTTAARFEWPDPLPSCAGYKHPAGAPVALLLGYGAQFKSAAIKVNGEPVAACLLTVKTYHGLSAEHTRVGQAVLASQGVAILLPKQPLPPGATVKVSFKAVAGTHSWGFRVK